MKPNNQKDAFIRICACCCFVFDSRLTDSTSCPICEYVSYGARFVLGSNYQIEKKLQRPHKEQIEARYLPLIDKEVERNMNKYHESIKEKVFTKLGMNL